MRSRNKPAPTAAEARHIKRLSEMACAVCDEPGPSEVHEPEQGYWWVSLPLCISCHRGPEGWHGTRLRWTLRKVSELGAINQTIQKAMA